MGFDLGMLLDVLFAVGWLMALALVGLGAGLSLPDLAPDVGDTPGGRSPRHTETY